MGRLPSQWAGRVIMDRFPYVFAAELALTTGQRGVQFPEASFMHAVDKPFEIHRMIPRVYAQDSDAILLPTQPDQDLLSALVRVNINNLGLDQIITKTPTLISLLTKGSSERTWEWADPMYLERSQQIQVVCDALTFPSISELNTLKVSISFEGFLCVVAPPSENR